MAEDIVRPNATNRADRDSNECLDPIIMARIIYEMMRSYNNRALLLGEPGEVEETLIDGSFDLVEISKLILSHLRDNGSGPKFIGDQVS